METKEFWDVESQLEGFDTRKLVLALIEHGGYKLGHTYGWSNGDRDKDSFYLVAPNGGSVHIGEK